MNSAPVTEIKSAASPREGKDSLELTCSNNTVADRKCQGRIDKYYHALKTLPAPGHGCHNGLMKVANLARNAGISEEVAFEDIRSGIPRDGRKVPDREIRDAIRKAYSSTFIPKSRPRVHKKKALHIDDIFQKYHEMADESELWERSYIRLDQTPGLYDTKLTLSSLFKLDDILFLGSQYDTGLVHVKKVSEWLNFEGLNKYPHIIPNPLTGEVGLTKDGKASHRADSCIKSFPFAVVEFDGLPREKQIAFWLWALDKGLPVAALIDSGGKSIHGWLGVHCKDAGEWEKKIYNKLFPQHLVPLGADPACKNSARLSRLPGHYRTEKYNWQRLLYLNPKHGRNANACQ